MASPLMARFSEQASIEEFIEAGAELSPAVDQVVTELPVVEITEDFGGTIEDPMVDVAQAETIAGQLDELAVDVDAVKTIPAMESYGRIYTQMVTNVGYELPTQPSVEAFDKTRGGKRALAKQIRGHASHIRRVANLGLEDFVDNVDGRLKSLTEEYRHAIKDLEKIRPNLDAPDETVKVDQKAIWKMFHRNNKLIKSPAIIQEEEKNLREMTSSIKQAVQKITTGQTEGGLLRKDEYEMLFNRNVAVGETAIKVKDLGTPKAERAYSGSDIGWIIGWGLVFNIVGLVGALLFKSATGEEKTESKRSTQEMMIFVDTVKKMSSIVKEVDDDIAKLLKFINTKGEEAGDLKRMASPVLQLAVFVVQQCTDLAKGSRILFGKIARG